MEPVVPDSVVPDPVIPESSILIEEVEVPNAAVPNETAPLVPAGDPPAAEDANYQTNLDPYNGMQILVMAMKKAGPPVTNEEHAHPTRSARPWVCTTLQPRPDHATPSVSAGKGKALIPYPRNLPSPSSTPLVSLRQLVRTYPRNLPSQRNTIGQDILETQWSECPNISASPAPQLISHPVKGTLCGFSGSPSADPIPSS
jgi:hypothetical protein